VEQLQVPPQSATQSATPSATQSETPSATQSATPSATQSETPSVTLSEPRDIPAPDAIIYNFPTGRPSCNLKLHEVLDKTAALDKYTDRNSMLYTYHQMRQDEKKSISALANWEQILEEAKTKE
jgi:hypothetical protein